MEATSGLLKNGRHVRFFAAPIRNNIVGAFNIRKLPRAQAHRHDIAGEKRLLCAVLLRVLPAQAPHYAGMRALREAKSVSIDFHVVV